MHPVDVYKYQVRGQFLCLGSGVEKVNTVLGKVPRLLIFSKKIDLLKNLIFFSSQLPKLISRFFERKRQYFLHTFRMREYK